MCTRSPWRPGRALAALQATRRCGLQAHRPSPPFGRRAETAPSVGGWRIEYAILRQGYRVARWTPLALPLLNEDRVLRAEFRGAPVGGLAYVRRQLPDRLNERYVPGPHVRHSRPSTSISEISEVSGFPFSFRRSPDLKTIQPVQNP